VRRERRQTKKSNAGRPSLGAAARKRSVLVRLTHAERGTWQARADALGVTLSEFVRATVEATERPVVTLSTGARSGCVGKMKT